MEVIFCLCEKYEKLLILRDIEVVHSHSSNNFTIRINFYAALFQSGKTLKQKFDDLITWLQAVMQEKIPDLRERWNLSLKK